MLYENYETDKRHIEEIKKIKEKYKSLNYEYIDGLNKRFIIRPYQYDCFARFEYEFNEWQEYGEEPLHLFFNLSTGSGKTLIMAENILFLYEQGYRNFIFFVHQNAILDKTKDNFLTKKSNKYLFAENIIFNSKKINIREVESFTTSNTDDINIIFTTCAALHSNITEPKENKLSLDSVKDIPIVLLADEAHHLLSNTKDGITALTRGSWQDTKNKLLNSNPKNILLEYSATIDLEDENIKKDYKNKIIIKYGLKEFREDGYSKDIYLFKSDLNNNERILSALIMSLYRQSVAENYSVKNSSNQIHFDNNFKPVIFVKSSNIDTSKADLQSFKEYLPQITANDIEFILNSDDIRIQKAKKWLLNKNTYEQIAEDIKLEFGADFDKTIRIVNSKDNSSDKSKAEVLNELNNLDTDGNKVRIVFAVQMLTEGWDVLCLYDIVRLDEKKKDDNKNVTSDIQLIGRGCRYNPFYINTDIDKKYTRKYDEIQEDDLRCLEELYYYSKNDNKYISKLKDGLKKEGLQINDNNTKVCLEELKTNPKTTSRWLNRLVYENKLVNVNSEEKKTIFDYNVKKDSFEEILHSKIKLSSTNVYDTTKEKQDNYYTKIIKLSDKTILRKAMDINSFYNFNNLVKYLPNMKTKEELFDNLRKEIEIKLTVSEDIDEIKRKDLLNIYTSVLKKIEKTIKSNNYKQIGSKVFTPKYLKDCLKDYSRNINITPQSENTDGIDINDVNDNTLRVDLKNKDWYAFKQFYGNSLEKKLIRHISDKINDKSYPFDKCDNLLLIRNHSQICKLYDFNSDRGFEPDFLLFFTRNNEQMNYMLFIESKGDHLKGEDNDKWKADFMLSIEDNAQLQDNNLGANKYKIIGLKFFTEDENEFKESMKNMFERNHIS